MSGSGSSTNGGSEKEKEPQWYFTAEQLASSPSRRHGIDADMELSYRQMTAYLIQEMGQRLQVSQLCINTAIVYMHRFYAFHSFTHFHRNNIAAASLFLAAKVEEQPRKLEHVIKAGNKCLSLPTTSTTDAYYIEQAQELVFNENVLLQTLGFDVAIDHPHTHVVKTCHLVKACKDLAQTSYFLASNSLHLTSMCLQYKPTVVACFCIYLACKWSRWEIPQSTEGKHWFHYVDKTVTMDLLKQLTDEFIAIYEKSPSRLKSKLNSIKALAQGASNRAVNRDKRAPTEEWRMVDMMNMYHSSINTNDVSGGIQSGAQSASYSGQNSSEQLQTQRVSPALLPPPPQPSQQQMRKAELHSSQHRSHHNSSSSSSHHHAKLSFPSGDVSDHKSSHKQQQQPFGGGGSLARSRDHQTMMTSASAANSRAISTSGGRSSSSLTPQANTQRQQSTQGHQIDVNYHKSRERTNILSGSITHGVATHTGHKLSTQKQETTSRVISKESSSTGKIQEQAKQQGLGKMFAPPSMSVTQYGSSQSKMDPSHDVSRSMMHNQRTYGTSSNVPSGNSALGYHQSQLNRQSSGGGGNTKHDQPKPISLHMQQQQQHHKQSAPPEIPYNTGSHDQQQAYTHLQPPPAPPTSVSYPTLRPSELLHTTEDHSNSQLSSAHSHNSITQHASQPHSHTQSRTSSMFSPPEWNDKLQPIMGGGNFSNNHLNSAPGDSFNSFNSFKMQSIPSSNCNKDQSPKRSDRDRVSDTATKKEKGRSSHSGMDSSLMIVGRSSSQQLQQLNLQQQQQQQIKSSITKNLNPGTNMTVSAVKRPNETVTFKSDDMLRDNKIRKIDSTSLLPSSYSESSKLVNGIETNPDFVSSLLKEGLCPRNDLLKTEQLATPSLQPPAELLEPTTTLTTLNKCSKSVNVESLSMDIGDGQSSSKTEKKKKKDKHKHKEKDKSKDREERKKHKREKERHKERDRESDNSEHVKIKISKEKLEGSTSASSESLGFKIKIPKDRITNEINSGGVGGGNGSSIVHGNVNVAVETSSSTATPALKIKISKDKLENYSSGPHADSLNAVPSLPTTAQSSAGLYSSFVSQGVVSTGVSSHNSNSSKKKDRDRDKDKKRAVHDLTKSNGSSTVSASVTAASTSGGSVPSVHMSTTSSKSQNSSKIQQLTNNLNQLFGESNDDDDEDDNDVYSNYSENIKSTYLNKLNITSATVAPSTAPTSFTSSSSSSSQALRQNNNYGSRQIQSNFNQHNSQHYINQMQQQHQQR